jgi:hypothetical protein
LRTLDEDQDAVERLLREIRIQTSSLACLTRSA